MREKMIELIRKADKEDHESRTQDEHYGFMADRLMESGVTIPVRCGHWINRGEGAARWVECSYCHVCGSPQWKVCPVCGTRMVKDND